MKRNPILFCRLQSIILYVVLLTFCHSCTSSNFKDNDQYLFVDLYIRYLEGEQQLKAQASFRKGDSIATDQAIKLPKVTFQNKAMKDKTLPDNGYRYTLQQQTKALSEYKFQFQPKDCPLVEQKINMSPITDFSIKNGIQKSKGMSLQMNPINLTANETLVLLFNDQNNKASSLEVKGPIQTTEITFRPQQLQSLSLGKGQLYLVKKQTSFIEKEKMNIKTVAEFYSKTIEVEVIE